jgi:hypothetical protein
MIYSLNTRVLLRIFRGVPSFLCGTQLEFDKRRFGLTGCG